MAKKHTYASCRDKECQRLACVAYREGREAGREEEREAARGDG